MIEIMSCPLCCSTDLTDFGTIFERKWEHRPGDDGVIRGFEVIHHHAVSKCGHCSAASISGPGIAVPG